MLSIRFQMEAVVIVILSSALFSIGGKAMADCEEGWYRPDPQGQCVRCSLCPHNQIIREACYEDQDTVCGPFKEFQMFQDSNSVRSGTNRADHNVLKQEAEENGYWHTITMVMVAILCVAGLLFVVFIVAVCYRCKKHDKESLMMQVDKDSDFEKLDSEVPTTSCGTGYTGGARHEQPRKKMEQFEISMEPRTHES